MFWSDLVLTFNAYEKGILPEPGGLGSQPLKFLPMMALLNSRMSEEARMERDRVNDADKNKRGKQSLTEQYMEQVFGETDPLAMTDPAYEAAVPQIQSKKRAVIKGASPDGHAAVPGLLKPRAGIGRK